LDKRDKCLVYLLMRNKARKVKGFGGLRFRKHFRAY
jgi:hypothetical protein